MNERIKELYDQASIRYSVYEILKPRDERKSIPDIFAELIVRECQSRVEQYVYHRGGVTSMPDNVLMKHFGVK